MSIDPKELKYQLAHIKDDRSTEGLVTAMVLVSLATIAVILRLWSRKLVGMKLKLDDYLIMVALVSHGSRFSQSLIGRLSRGMLILEPTGFCVGRRLLYIPCHQVWVGQAPCGRRQGQCRSLLTGKPEIMGLNRAPLGYWLTLGAAAPNRIRGPL